MQKNMKNEIFDLDCFKKYLRHCAFDESSLSIQRIKISYERGQAGLVSIGFFSLAGPNLIGFEPTLNGKHKVHISQTETDFLIEPRQVPVNREPQRDSLES